MKRFAILLSIALLIALLSGTVSAYSYNPSINCEIEFEVPKTDPSYIVKDGKIGVGEYEKINIDTNEDTTSLNLAFGSNSAMLTDAENMLTTMEYYFSWDDVNGLNFAVRCKPTTIQQVLDIDSGDIPQDNFLTNVGLHFTADCMQHNPDKTTENDMILRYSISKRTDTGAYLKGWYWALGKSGSYNPTPGEDFIIVYGDDGYVTYEWSIPMDEMYPGATAGTEMYLSIAACAGTDTKTGLYQDCYSVVMGDYGFLVKRTDDSSHAVATLSDRMITVDSGNGSGDDSTDNGTTPSAGDNTKNSDNTTSSNTDVTPADNNSADNSSADSSANTNGTSSSAKTGDILPALAVCVTMSVLGIVTVKKRRK